MSPAMVYFKFDPFTKNSRMFLLRESGLSLANMELFLLKIDSGHLTEYTKLANMRRDWLSVDNPDVAVCDHEYLNRFSKSLFEREFYVLKKRGRAQDQVSTRAAQLVKQANTSSPFFPV